MGRSLGWLTFEHGAGPLLRTCLEGERQHVQRGPLECGVPEFAGKALGEGVWVGFRPSTLEGVSEGVSKCRGRALGGGVGPGLGSVRQEGGSEGRGLGPGAQQARRCLSGQGKH